MADVFGGIISDLTIVCAVSSSTRAHTYILKYVWIILTTNYLGIKKRKGFETSYIWIESRQRGSAASLHNSYWTRNSSKLSSQSAWHTSIERKVYHPPLHMKSARFRLFAWSTFRMVTCTIDDWLFSHATREPRYLAMYLYECSDGCQKHEWAGTLLPFDQISGLGKSAYMA